MKFSIRASEKNLKKAIIDTMLDYPKIAVDRNILEICKALGKEDAFYNAAYSILNDMRLSMTIAQVARKEGMVSVLHDHEFDHVLEKIKFSSWQEKVLVHLADYYKVRQLIMEDVIDLLENM